MTDKFATLQAKLESDKSLAERLLSKETPEEVQDLLKSEGLDFSKDEIEALRISVMKALEGEDEELSEDDLEEVAGGAAVTLGTVIAVGKILGGTGAVAGLTNNVSRGRW